MILQERSGILRGSENVDLKGKLAELRRWLEQSPLVPPCSVRENRIRALFTSLPKKYA